MKFGTEFTAMIPHFLVKMPSNFGLDCYKEFKECGVKNDTGARVWTR